MSIQKLKFKTLGKTQVALQIFRDFAGSTQNIDVDAEKQAFNMIQRSLDAYGKSIFALRVDMPSGNIPWHNGMKSVLGCDNLTRYDQFEDCIHAPYLGSYNYWSTILFQAIAKETINPDGLVYHIKVPLVNGFGKPFWYNQHSIALIDDKKGGILSFLSLYTFDSEWFEGAPILMLPFVSRDNKIHEMDKTLKKLGGDTLLDNEFTDMEKKVLTCYALNQKPLEHLPRIKANTLYDYNVNILQKAKGFFRYDFGKAQNFAKFLRNNHLL
jgi:hypothetical protein